MNLTNKRIIVAGEVCVDEYIHTYPKGKSPEHPDIDVVKVSKIETKDGMSANVAKNLESIGAVPILITNNKKDSIIKKTRLLVNEQHIIRIDHDQYDKACSDTDIRNTILNHCKSDLVEGIIMQDYGNRFWNKSLCQDIIHSSNKPVFVDPYPTSDLSWYKGCEILTPNLKEIKHLTKKEQLVDAMKYAIKKTEAKACVTTLGENGIAVLESGNDYVFYIDTERTKVVDVCGAGDTVIAVITYLYLNGMDIIDSARVANRAAALTIKEHGVASITKEQLLSLI